jgi:hypothetical protein
MVAGAYQDSLTIVTQAPGDTSPHVIPLDESPSGARLSAAMQTTAFGPVNVGSSKPLPLSVRNDGDRAIDVTIAASGEFTPSPKVATSVGAMSTEQASIVFAPTGGGMTMSNVTFSTSNGPLCSSAIAALTVSGTGLAAVATFSPALGVQSPCGQGSQQATLTVRNTGNSPLTLSNVSVGAPFSLVSATSTPIAMGQSGSIVVSAPAAAETGGTTHVATLSFKTNESGSPTHMVAVTQTIMGANLYYAYDAATFDQIVNDTYYFSISCMNTTAQPQPMFIQNTGNQDAVVAIQASNGSMTWAPQSVQMTVSAGSNVSVTVSPNFSPAEPPSSVGQSVSGAICIPLPASVQVAVTPISC